MPDDERCWAVVFVNGAAHLLPVYDTITHEETDCPCWPKSEKHITESGQVVTAWIHNADDCREFDELAEATWH